MSRIDEVLRIRRHQPSRLEGIVDAAYFAVTLLVIPLGLTALIRRRCALRLVPVEAAP